MKPEIRDTAPRSSANDIHPSGLPETKTEDPAKDSGAALAETNQTTQIQAVAFSRGESGNGGAAGLPPPDEINTRPESQSLQVQDPQTWVVKNGETLTGIASRFFPENKEEGLKKIRAANPAIEDMNQIFSGQILIIPQTVVTKKVSN